MKKACVLFLALALLLSTFSVGIAEETQVLQLWDVIVRDPHPAARDQVIAAFEAAHPGSGCAGSHPPLQGAPAVP